MDLNKKTILFDFGNILINLDYPTCFKAFEDVLKRDFSKGLPEKLQAAMFRYEKGELQTESFLWALQQYNPEAEVRDIINAWNAILGNLPMARFDMLAELGKTYNIAMLSNINDMHEQAIHKRVIEDLNIEDFHSTYFDKVFYSHHIGHRKPEPACYTHVQAKLDVPPADILFIDDMPINIEAAHAAGWKGVVHDPTHEIVDMVQEYIAQAFG